MHTSIGVTSIGGPTRKQLSNFIQMEESCAEAWVSHTLALARKIIVALWRNPMKFLSIVGPYARHVGSRFNSPSPNGNGSIHRHSRDGRLTK